MFNYLILVFTILPALELYLLITVGSRIGALNTSIIIILMGIIGAFIIKLQGFHLLNKIQNSINRGIMPRSELLDGLMILAGGLALLIPGFITDVIGFLLLIPFIRAILKKFLKKRIENLIQKGQIVSFNQTLGGHDRYNDIDI